MPKYMKSRTAWQYSEEFKVKVVQLSLLESVLVKDVAVTLDIHPFMLPQWQKEYREGKVVADDRKCIRRLMKKMGLQSVAPGPNTSKPALGHKIYPY